MEILSGLYLMFRYNFLETIAIFFNRLKSYINLNPIAIKIINTNCPWIEVCQNTGFSEYKLLGERCVTSKKRLRGD